MTSNGDEREPESFFESERGGALMLLVVLLPWLFPLAQAFRGEESFGWSAAFGLMLGLWLVLAGGRALWRSLRARVRARRRSRRPWRPMP